MAPARGSAISHSTIEGHTVRYTYPHVIDNGAGERLTFARRTMGTTGDRLEGETAVEPGAGPPMHVHHLTTEAFVVRSGLIGYQRLGEAEQFAGPGESVVFPAGVAHRFWNAGTETLHCDAWLEPAYNAEYILTELFRSMRAHGNGRPALLDVAFLMCRYRSEVRMVGVPVVVERVLNPVLAAVSALLGRCRRFAGAPTPVRLRAPAR